jgi:hypothetical protein
VPGLVEKAKEREKVQGGLMKLTKGKANIVKKAVETWREERVLSAAESKHLLENLEVIAFDWKRLARYSFWASIACIIIAVGSVVADRQLMDLIKFLFNMPAAAKSILLGAAAAAGYYFGAIRRVRYPQKVFSNEALFFLGVLATAGAIAYLGEAVSSGGEHFSLLILLGCVVYAVLGIFLDSKLIWVFSILSLGSWFGTETGYESGWGAYYLGMNYPLRFVAFGLALTLASYSFLYHPRLKTFFSSTHKLGMLYLFIALWILSIFGNYGDWDRWYNVKQYELFGWSVLFGLAAAATLYHGLKYDNAASRGFGLTFLFLNLYTRFFEYLWDSLHKAIFFALLGLSLWWLGSKAENIWNLKWEKRKL